MHVDLLTPSLRQCEDYSSVSNNNFNTSHTGFSLYINNVETATFHNIKGIGLEMLDFSQSGKFSSENSSGMATGPADHSGFLFRVEKDGVPTFF